MARPPPGSAKSAKGKAKAKATGKGSRWGRPARSRHDAAWSPKAIAAANRLAAAVKSGKRRNKVILGEEYQEIGLHSKGRAIGRKGYTPLSRAAVERLAAHPHVYLKKERGVIKVLVPKTKPKALKVMKAALKNEPYLAFCEKLWHKIPRPPVFWLTYGTMYPHWDYMRQPLAALKKLEKEVRTISTSGFGNKYFNIGTHDPADPSTYRFKKELQHVSFGSRAAEISWGMKDGIYQQHQGGGSDKKPEMVAVLECPGGKELDKAKEELEKNMTRIKDGDGEKLRSALEQLLEKQGTCCYISPTLEGHAQDVPLWDIEGGYLRAEDLERLRQKFWDDMSSSKERAQELADEFLPGLTAISGMHWIKNVFKDWRKQSGNSCWSKMDSETREALMECFDKDMGPAAACREVFPEAEFHSCLLRARSQWKRWAKEPDSSYTPKHNKYTKDQKEAAHKYFREGLKIVDTVRKVFGDEYAPAKGKQTPKEYNAVQLWYKKWKKE